MTHGRASQGMGPYTKAIKQAEDDIKEQTKKVKDLAGPACILRACSAATTAAGSPLTNWRNRHQRVRHRPRSAQLVGPGS